MSIAEPATDGRHARRERNRLAVVDAMLALILMIGGVTGAQFGARAGQKIRGEHLRLLLGLLVGDARPPVRARPPPRRARSVTHRAHR